MGHIFRTLFHQNTNVGLFGLATDKVCLLSSAVHEDTAKKVEETLDVPVYQTLLVGTELIGAFAAGNNNGLVLPSLTLPAEQKKLEAQKIPFTLIETDHTALGNNIVCTDDKALISPDLKPVMEDIKQALGVKEIQTYQIGELTTIGALVVVGKSGILVTSLATPEERSFIEEFFGMPVRGGTVNLGSPYVRSGIIANQHGFVFGAQTGGPEATHIDSSLGFIEE